MVRMIVDKPFPYRGKAMAVGEEFDCDDEHVRTFQLVGQAHVKEGKQVYETRVMTAKRGRGKAIEAA